MSSEQEQKQSLSNPKLKEFQSLLDEDFKKRKLKENRGNRWKKRKRKKRDTCKQCQSGRPRQS